MDINYSIPVTLFDYQEREDGLYSLAKLKIFYIGQTQDRRLFTKEFSEQLIKTLPYVPVVGYYDTEEEDFIGHNEAVQHIYGIVPEDTSIEYVKEKGREYVVCDVILYTGRLDQTGEIAKKIVGKPHSLELNPGDTTYVINKNTLGKVENIEFKTGSLLGLSILGDKEQPAFDGSGFFKNQENIISEELRYSMNEFYRNELQQCKFELNQQRFIRDSYENRRERAYEALKEMYLSVEFEIKEMNDMFIVYKEYYEDQNGKRYNYNQIQYKDNGYEVELIGGPIKVYKMYLTAEEIDMLSEPADSLDYRTLEDLDLKPTEAMANAAKRGLDLRSEYGRGGTSVGIARARDLSNRKNLSPDTVRRMFSFFSRHEVNKGKDGWEVGDDKYPSNGLIAWLLWGGDPGYTWAESKWNQIKKIREAEEMSLVHENVEVKHVSEVKEMEYPKDEEMIEEETVEEEMVEEEEKEMEGHPDEEDMEYPKEEEMAEMPEEVEAIMDIIQKYPEIIKEIIEEMMPGSEDEEDMEYPKDEEDMEYPKDKEEMGTEQNSTEASSVVEDDAVHGEKEEEIATKEIEEDFNSSALDNSEREELEAFRRERKEGLIASFEEELKSEFIQKLRSEVDGYSYDELDVILSKEFTRVNRVERKQKPDAFIYNNKTTSAKPKSEQDLVRSLVEKYK